MKTTKPWRAAATVSVILGALLALPACKIKKDGNGAEAKSLQDLTKAPGANGPDYRCGTAYTGGILPDYIEPLRALVEPADSPLKNVLLGTAQALPAPIAMLISGTGTRIRLVANAATECAGTPFSASEQEISGKSTPVQACWRQKSPGDKPELILQADTAVIQRSFVRLAAYLYSEFLMARVAQANAPAPFNAKEWQEAAASFKTARAALAKALLVDLANYDDATSAKFAAMNAKSPEAFGNIAFAEAQDSYYCGAASRTAFQSLFRASYKVFADKSDTASMVSMFGERQ